MSKWLTTMRVICRVLKLCVVELMCCFQIDNSCSPLPTQSDMTAFEPIIETPTNHRTRQVEIFVLYTIRSLILILGIPAVIRN